MYHIVKTGKTAKFLTRSGTWEPVARFRQKVAAMFTSGEAASNELPFGQKWVCVGKVTNAPSL